ncbi:thiamine-triphosphatase [Microdochium nivale]|nr:thiamine-triphosphatase [Microdochium nivale]
MAATFHVALLRLGACRPLPCLGSWRTALKLTISARAATAHATRRVSTQPADSSTKPMPVVEVERKFAPSDTLLRLLHSGDGCAKLGARRLDDELIRDTYYDLEDQLGSRGIWVRRRRSWKVPTGLRAGLSFWSVHSLRPYTLPSGMAWGEDLLEAKIRLGGDVNNSRFHEITGLQEITDHLKTLIPGFVLDNLAAIVDLQTYRMSWSVLQSSLLEPLWPLASTAAFSEVEEAAENVNSAHDKTSSPDDDALSAVTIVVDYATRTEEAIREDTSTARSTTPSALEEFNHVVGELELTAVVAEDAEVAKLQVAEELDQRLREMMVARNDLFLVQAGLRGKLSAFREWEEQRAELVRK